MLSISDPITSAAGAVDYYSNKALEAYYTEGKLGRWFGGAAEFLQLPESVNPETFHSLLMGFSPDGNRALVKNAGEDNRTCGWDLTFSAPKPVSRLWATLPEAERRGIEAAHRNAVETTLKIAEEMFGISRSGQGGKVHERAKLIFAVFDEYTSRANDMQIHSHCVLANTGVRANGKTGALHSIHFFRAKMVLGAVYQTTLAANLRRSHCLTIIPERVAFGIEGVPKHLCRLDSKRRIVIEKALAERGLTSAEAAKVAARETRPAKKHFPLAKLFPHWQETGRQHGFGPEEALKLIQARTQTQTLEQSLDSQIKKAISQIPKEEQTKRNLLRAARQAAFESGARGDKLMEVLTKVRLPSGAPLVWTPFPKSKEFHRASRQEPVETKQPARTKEVETQPVKKNSESRQNTSQHQAEITLPSVPPKEPAQQTKAQATAEEQQAETKQPIRTKEAVFQPAEALTPDEAMELETQAAHIYLESLDQFLSEESSTVTPLREQPSGTKAQAKSGPSGQSKDKEHQSSQSDSKRAQKINQSQYHRQESQRQNTGADHASHKAAAADMREEDRKRHAAEKTKKKQARQQKQRNLKFVRVFGAAVDRIFPEKQTRHRLTKLANRLAEIHMADNETLERTLAHMRPGAERSFLHVEEPRLFAKSPISPVKWWRLPKLALGEKPRKWGDITWKKNLPIGELRVQKRRLCPRAPKWSPLHGIEIPALRFSVKRSNFKKLHKTKSATAAKTKAKQQDRKYKTAKADQKEQSQSQSQTH